MRRTVLSILAAAASLVLACGCYRYSPEYSRQKGIRPGEVSDSEFRQARNAAYSLVRLRLDGQRYVLTENTALMVLDSSACAEMSESLFTPEAAQKLGDSFRLMYVTARIESDDGRVAFREYAVCLTRSSAFILYEHQV